jgi:dTDP-glucose 4,6-dehydratase
MIRPILITGGAGFIGSATIRKVLRDTDDSIVNVDVLTYAANLTSLPAADDNDRLYFEQVNIADGSALSRVFDKYQPRAVLHLAAESHVDRSIDGPAAFIDTNIVGTYTLLETSLAYWTELDATERAGFRLVHVSTDEVFGEAEPARPFRETTPYAPNSPYAASKAAADHLARAWHKTYGLPVIITNCSNNYGPYQFPEKLIPHMIISALEGKPLGLYGDGTQVRDWLHVEDHVDALLTVIETGRIGEVYAVGARNERANIEVVSNICLALNNLRPHADGSSYGDLITYVPDRPGHDQHYAIDPSKIENELGWIPTHDWETGLAETVAWYLDNEPWWRGIRGSEYRGQRLGLGR